MVFELHPPGIATEVQVLDPFKPKYFRRAILSTHIAHEATVSTESLDSRSFGANGQKVAFVVEANASGLNELRVVLALKLQLVLLVN